MKPAPNFDIYLEALVPGDCIGQRVDQVAAGLFDDFSRAQLQQWIKNGALTLNGATCKPKDKILGGELLELRAELEPHGDWQPQDIPLHVIYEDEDLVVIDKPAGLVVHPGAGNPKDTLLNALLYRYPEQQNIPRAGIVHRLDKDTSGLMVVARTLEAQTSLVAQLQARSVSREYEAVIQGVPVGGATVDAAIGRHPRVRTRMAVVTHGGKPAITHYRILKKFDQHAHVRVKLETGRTHQIRVHMAHIGFPLVGDPLYGGRLKIPGGASDQLRDCLKTFGRQALHAVALSLEHPESGKQMSWKSALTADFVELLQALEQG